MFDPGFSSPRLYAVTKFLQGLCHHHGVCITLQLDGEFAEGQLDPRFKDFRKLHDKVFDNPGASCAGHASYHQRESQGFAIALGKAGQPLPVAKPFCWYVGVLLRPRRKFCSALVKGCHVSPGDELRDCLAAATADATLSAIQGDSIVLSRRQRVTAVETLGAGGLSDQKK